MGPAEEEEEAGADVEDESKVDTFMPNTGFGFNSDSIGLGGGPLFVVFAASVNGLCGGLLLIVVAGDVVFVVICFGVMVGLGGSALTLSVFTSST